MRWIPLALCAGAVLAGAGCTPEPDEARADYAMFCAGCHGPAGRGDGPAGRALARAPADLTTIAARNGGTFPRIDVMSKIHGYSGTLHDFSAMPGFAALLEGRTVLVDQGDGTRVATPKRLVALTDYLERLQR